MTETAGRTSPIAAQSNIAPPYAVWLSVTEELLSDFIAISIGDGRAVEPMEQQVSLPAMGDVRLRMGLTITGGTVDLSPDDGDRARVTVRADGDVAVLSSDFEGDTVSSGPMGMPTPPAPIPVEVVALVDPFIRLNADNSGEAGVDLRTAELVRLGIDQSAPVPDGVDLAVWTGVTQMLGLMFMTMGEGLWAGLAEHVGSITIDLPSEFGDVMFDLGVAHGSAQVSVGSGVLSFALPARPEVRGSAEPVPVAGKKVGIGLASSAVEGLALQLVERVVGGLPIPFEIDLEVGEQQIGSRLRQTRLLTDRFPDLRASLRTEVRPRLVRDRLEVAVTAAWVELPSVLPGFLNVVNRRLGSLVSFVPYRFRLPSTIQVPVGGDSGDTIPVRVDDLRVGSDSVGVVLALE